MISKSKYVLNIRTAFQETASSSCPQQPSVCQLTGRSIEECSSYLSHQRKEEAKEE
jgi:hypothetical protein